MVPIKLGTIIDTMHRIYLYGQNYGLSVHLRCGIREQKIVGHGFLLNYGMGKMGGN